MTPQSLHGKAEVQGRQVRVDDEEVCEMLLDRANDFMAVCLCQPFEGGFADDVAEVDVVLAVFGLAELVDEELDGCGRRTDKA
jgi:hypothetical protein